MKRELDIEVSNTIDITDKIAARIINDSGYNHLKSLIRHYRIEKDLLNLTSYEDAWFFPIANKITFVQGPDIERISMVYPASYYFQLIIKFEGYFKVKYNYLSVPLPKSLDPFTLRYSGIVTPVNENFHFKNEKLEIVG
ncbi:MAG: hypothetical protein K8R53_11155 [Bacteroidales bacterium]|nr:hypothetical protein [Bacteroidales bacterium]